MLRVLAIVWHDLREAGISIGNVEQFFSELEPLMKFGPDGIADDDPVWMKTGAFLPGSTAPQARQGTVAALAKSIEAWYFDGIPTT